MTGHGNIPFHVAIIMDGNGRWAKARNLPRTAGHHQGAKTLRTIIQAAPDLGISHLTLFGFSTENWKRPADEVKDLMGLLRQYLKHEIKEFHELGACLEVIGERSGLADDIVELIGKAEALTKQNQGIKVIFALNYGGRADILHAAKSLAQQVKDGLLSIDNIDESCFSKNLWSKGMPDPDLLIRTSGEERISNFLLWQMAYTEMIFTKVLWPDFTPSDFKAVVEDFKLRVRRFGSH